MNKLMKECEYLCLSTSNSRFLAQYYTLRKSLYSNKLNYQIAEIDKWDDDCFVFVVLYKGRVIAGSRLNLAKRNELLPMEEENFILDNMLDTDNSIYAEYSKLAIDPKHSGNGVEMLLYSEVDSFCRSHSVKYVFSIVPNTQARLYNRAFQKYRNLGGTSKYIVLNNIEIPTSVNKKYNSLSEKLTVVYIL